MKGRTHRQVIKATTDILTFGKFKDCTIQYVLDNEPSYLLWLDDEGIVSIPTWILDDAIEDTFDEYMDDYLRDEPNHNDFLAD